MSEARKRCTKQEKGSPKIHQDHESMYHHLEEEEDGDEPLPRQLLLLNSKNNLAGTFRQPIPRDYLSNDTTPTSRRSSFKEQQCSPSPPYSPKKAQLAHSSLGLLVLVGRPRPVSGGGMSSSRAVLRTVHSGTLTFYL
jgi:hypothetical protein